MDEMLSRVARAICNASEVSTVRGGVCRLANLHGGGECTVCIAQARAAIEEMSDNRDTGGGDAG